MRRQAWLIGLGAVVLVAASVATTLIVMRPVELQPNAAPWWGVPIFTLAGGVGGALIAGFFLGRVEDKRIRDARQRRSEDTARDAVARLIAVSGQKIGAVLASENESWTVHNEQELWSALSMVIVVAPDGLRRAAEEFVNILARFGVEHSKAPLGQKGNLFREKVSKKHGEFISVARRELGYES